MPNINVAYQWAINACNAPDIGYSQQYRRGQKVNGITYYDCSSFISASLTQGGFFTTNPWFTTANMREYLVDVGFVQTDINGIWTPGAIVWRSGHTEMVYSSGADPGSGITMGAHQSGVPLADQVSINNSVSTSASWTSIYEYPGGATSLTWISKNAYLTDEEMANNAYCFYSYMYNYATLSAIAGMLGNMQRESTINPGIWQNLDEGNYDLGFGLVQWTPATNYTDWATANGYEIGDGNGQCQWLITQTVPTGQWIATDTYPQSWNQFLAFTGTPEEAASIFLYNFERAGVSVEDERRQNARRWYNYLEGLSPIPPGGITTKKFKWWMYTPLYNRRNNYDMGRSVKRNRRRY